MCMHRLSKSAPRVIDADYLVASPVRCVATLKDAREALGGRTVGRQGWVLVTERDGDVVSVERLAAGLSYVDAELLAEKAVAPDSAVTLAYAVEGNGKGTIYKRAVTLDYTDILARLNSGIADIDVMMAAAGFTTSIQKADDIFPQDEQTERLVAKLAKLAKGTVDATVAELVEIAESTDWVALGEVELGKQITAIADGFTKAGGAFAGLLASPLLQHGMRVVKAVRAWDAKKYEWGPGGSKVPSNGPITATFDAVDKASVNFLRKSTVNFVTDQFKQRSAQWSEAARSITARGFEQGLSGDEIGKDLSRWLEVRGGNPNYYRVVANAYTVRAEAYGHLSTYSKAGIETAIFTAILDERTSDQCRWADGKFVNVGRALDLLKGLESLDDPMDVKYENPWVRERQLDDGKKEIFVRGKDGTDTVLAEISRSGMGNRDDRGEYTDKVNDILSQSIGPPPLHGLCRSTLQPVIV